MQIIQKRAGFIMPELASDGAGAFDIYMPEGGTATEGFKLYPLGFASAVPTGYVAVLLPRSSSGFKYGLELMNTCGIIDSDYRGEWKAALRTKSGRPFTWETGDRLLQFLLIPSFTPHLDLVLELGETKRGNGGFGSTG